jgi:hypothetical protein
LCDQSVIGNRGTVPRKQFCNVENRAFPEGEFVNGPSGTTVHVMDWVGSGESRHAQSGHSLDGWLATWDPKAMTLIYKDPVLLDAAEGPIARIV